MTKRSATGCPATSAVAPATRGSSRPSAWPLRRGARHDVRCVPRPRHLQGAQRPDFPPRALGRSNEALMTAVEDPPAVAGNRFVGQRVQRREDARLVTGHGTYVDDVVVPGMLHVAFLRCDIACGTITGLDVSAARE